MMFVDAWRFQETFTLDCHVGGLIVSCGCF